MCIFFAKSVLSNYRANKHKNRLIYTKTKETDTGYSKGVKLEELPIFKFQMLSNATENFDPVNKLGEGGFGNRLIVPHSTPQLGEKTEKMSKKNDLGRRKRLHDFNLRSTANSSLQFVLEDKEEKEKKLQAKKNKLKVDGSSSKKKGGSGFQVGKKLKTKLTPLAKAKAAQAMEVDK